MTLKEFKLDLDKLINISDQVFLVPHLGADFDAISSCIAMALIVRKYKKSFYIILDEEPTKIEPGVKKIIDDICTKFPIINMEKYKQLSKDNDLLIACDVNRDYLLCCKDYLDRFKNIAVIDHHEDDNGLKTSYKCIDVNSSSTAELMVDLLCMNNIKVDSKIANYLLAGIYLDTNKFTKNVSFKTMDINSRLMKKGASIDFVNELFEEDFLSDRKVQQLVNKANFFTYTIALAISSDDVKYTKEELAKVADYLLKYKVDAAFAAGFIDNDLISISARSKGRIDVGDVMKKLSGGGNVYSAATKIGSSSIDKVGEDLNKILMPDFCKNLIK